VTLRSYADLVKESDVFPTRPTQPGSLTRDLPPVALPEQTKLER
jgi:hypothetical protein